MAKVLIVDDEKGMRETLAVFLTREGHEVKTAEDAVEAIEMLKIERFDVVVTDIIMPKVNGIELTKAIMALPWNIKVILITGEPAIETATEAIRAGAFDYIAKPVTRETLCMAVSNASRLKSVEENNDNYRLQLENLIAESGEKIRHLAEEVKKSNEALYDALGLIMEAKHTSLAGHQEKTAKFAVKIAKAMKLPDDLTENIYIAAKLHDIGMATVPVEIVAKPRKLSPGEFSLVKEHCRAGYDLLQKVSMPFDIEVFVLQHHERLDGSGYPYGLMGDTISMGARILAVADVVSAMSNPRPQRPALDPSKIKEDLIYNKNSLYDPAVVDAYLSLV